MNLTGWFMLGTAIGTAIALSAVFGTGWFTRDWSFKQWTNALVWKWKAYWKKGEDYHYVKLWDRIDGVVCVYCNKKLKKKKGFSYPCKECYDKLPLEEKEVWGEYAEG